MYSDSRPVIGRKRQSSQTHEDNQIRRMTKDGIPASEISDVLGIDIKCIKSVIAHYMENRERFDAAMDGAQAVTRVEVVTIDPEALPEADETEALESAAAEESKARQRRGK